MAHHAISLAMAIFCGWMGWLMRRPGANSISRALGLLAFAAASALLDDATGGLLLGALAPEGANPAIEQILGKL